VITRVDEDPESAAVLANSVGLALLVVLATFSSSRLGLTNQLVRVNGHLGFVTRRPDGTLFSVVGFTIAGGKIVEMDILADPERLSRLDVSGIEG
jgi:RNA polymerase sigma-70 factor (ECF subfamily)